MKQLRRLIAAALLMAGITPAIAQTFPTVPSQTVIGRTAFGTGPAQAVPFSQLQAVFCSSFSLTAKGCVPPPGATTGRYLSDDIVTPWKALSTQQIVQGAGVTAIGTCSGTSLNCTLSATAATQYVVPSRATAAASDLSALSAIQTLGYTTPGDGGGATFKNVGTAPFLDSHVTSGSITNVGSAYTAGTYRSVFFSGGTGNNFIANVVVGGGGTITSVTIINAGGFGFTVGDVLTASGGNGQIGGTGTGFTWTVGAVSTPKASFTDSVGTHWQYVQGDAIYAKQFGAKFDWYRPTGDAGATNDQASIQAALNYASYVNEASVNFVTNSLAGTAVVWPSGTALVCGSGLRQFSSTWARGQGPQNSLLKICDTGIGATENFYTVCDERAQLACFGGQISDFGLTALTAPGNAGTFMLYSNAAQQQRFMSNINIYSGLRGCFRYDTGYGGAAIVGIYDYFCTVGSGNTQGAANVVNATSTMFSFNNGVIEASAYTGFGISFLAGLSKFQNFHFEGITTGINVQMTVATDKLMVDNVTGGSNCLELVRLQGTNTVNNFSITQTSKQGVCVNLVLNGQPSGANRATDVAPGVFVNFNP